MLLRIFFKGDKIKYSSVKLMVYILFASPEFILGGRVLMAKVSCENKKQPVD